MGVARESRLKQQADYKRELFVEAMKDSTALIREAKDVAHAFGVIVYDVQMGLAEGRGLLLVRRVDEVSTTIGRAGALVPPELTAQRNEVHEQLRALRMAILASANKNGDVRPANDAIQLLNAALQGFAAAFEKWKRDHWAKS